MQVQTEKNCPTCGQTIYLTAQICPYCGTYQKPLRSAPPGISKRRLKAILLAFFLGSFGAHKFFLRHMTQGILYFLFCWTFIPTVFGIIESINFLSLNNEAFEAKYGLYRPSTKPSI